MYDAFVDLLTGKRDVKATLGVIPFPELHQHSVSSHNYLKTLSKLMLTVGISDFNVMEDLLKPDMHRLQLHLSALINFSKFRESRLDTYSMWTKRTDELMDNKAELEERQNLDNQRLQALREQHKQQEPIQLTLTEECSQLEKQVHDLNVTQANLHVQIAKKKQQSKDTVHAIETLKNQIANCEADITTIRNAIVENPAALKAAIRDMTCSIESEQRNTAKIEEESQGLDRKVKVLTELQRDAREAVQLLRECSEEEKRAKNFETEIKELRSAMETLDSALQQRESEREQLEKQLKSLVDKTSRVKKQQKKRENEAERDLEKANAERSKAESELQQNENKIDENRRKAEWMELKLASMQKEHATEMSKMKDVYTQLVGQVNTYHSDLRQALATK